MCSFFYIFTSFLYTVCTSCQKLSLSSWFLMYNLCSFSVLLSEFRTLPIYSTQKLFITIILWLTDSTWDRACLARISFSFDSVQTHQILLKTIKRYLDMLDVWKLARFQKGNELSILSCLTIHFFSLKGYHTK